MCILIHCIDCGLDVIILLLFFERTGMRRCPLFIDREEGTTPKGKNKSKNYLLQQISHRETRSQIVSLPLLVPKFLASSLISLKSKQVDNSLSWNTLWFISFHTSQTIELHAPISSTQKLKLKEICGQFTYTPTLPLTWSRSRQQLFYLIIPARIWTRNL